MKSALVTIAKGLFELLKLRGLENVYFVLPSVSSYFLWSANQFNIQYFALFIANMLAFSIWYAWSRSYEEAAEEQKLGFTREDLPLLKISVISTIIFHASFFVTLGFLFLNVENNLSTFGALSGINFFAFIFIITRNSFFKTVLKQLSKTQRPAEFDTKEEPVSLKMEEKQEEELEEQKEQEERERQKEERAKQEEERREQEEREKEQEELERQKEMEEERNKEREEQEEREREQEKQKGEEEEKKESGEEGQEEEEEEEQIENIEKKEEMEEETEEKEEKDWQEEKLEERQEVKEEEPEEQEEVEKRRNKKRDKKKKKDKK